MHTLSNLAALYLLLNAMVAVLLLRRMPWCDDPETGEPRA